MAANRALEIVLPPTLYEQLQHAAEQSERPIEAVLLESLSLMYDAESADLEAVNNAIETYSDEQLWMVVHQRLGKNARKQLYALIEKGKQGTLSPAENIQLSELQDKVDDYTYLRSRALALLKERGHEVSHYFKSES